MTEVPGSLVGERRADTAGMCLISEEQGSKASMPNHDEARYRHPGCLRRIAYCKNGDAVSEIKKFGSQPKSEAEGDARYVTGFLVWLRGRCGLILSYSDRGATCTQGQVSAKVYRRLSGSRNPIGSLLGELRLWWATLLDLKRFGAEAVVCAASGAPLWAAWLYCRLSGARLVCSRHSSAYSEPDHPLGHLRGTINRWVIMRAKSVLCHGPFLRDELNGLGVSRDRLFMFSNSYAYLADKVPTEPDDNAVQRIVYAGSLRVDKGIVDLLEAATPLLATNPGLHLCYAGSGRDGERLATAARDSGVSEQIELLGYVEHTELISTLACALVVVTPSQQRSTESVCKVAVEAMVLGTPVVAPAFGPFPYIVSDGENGLLFEAGSVADLRKQIDRLVSNSGLQAALGQRAREMGKQWLLPERTFGEALICALGP